MKALNAINSDGSHSVFPLMGTKKFIIKIKHYLISLMLVRFYKNFNETCN